MIKGETKSGFKWKVADDALNDQELVETLAFEDDSDPRVVTKIAIKVLGQEQKQKLYEHVRNKKTGRVPSDKFQLEIAEIFDEIGKTNEEIKK